MSELFGNTTNFTPAFTGQELAIESGKADAQAFTSGWQAGSGGEKGKPSADQMQRLQQFKEFLGE